MTFHRQDLPEATLDWQLYFSVADGLAPQVIDDKVELRRATYAASIPKWQHLTFFKLASGHPFIHRFKLKDSASWRETVELVRNKWIEVFDDFLRGGQDYVFDDGYAALFFTTILFFGHSVIYRGHYSDTWKLSTSRERAMIMHGSGYLQQQTEEARRFIDRIQQFDFVRKQYPGGLSKLDAEAVVQHYGFPTNLLDFTYSPEIALFFAEGAVNHMAGALASPEQFGAIFAVPLSAIPDSFSLRSLPPL